MPALGGILSCRIVSRRIIIRHISLIGVLIAYQGLSLYSGCIKGKAEFHRARGREDLFDPGRLHGLSADFQGLSGLLDIDHSAEGDLLPDIVLHAAVGDCIGEGHHAVTACKMIAVFIDQLCLQDGLLCVFHIAQVDGHPVRIDKNILREHFHPPVILPFNLLDMVFPVGKGTQCIVRLCAQSKPETPGLLLPLSGITGSGLLIRLTARGGCRGLI